MSADVTTNRWGRSLVALLGVLVVLLCAYGCAQGQGGQPASAGAMTPKDFIMASVQFFLMALVVYWFLVLNPAQSKKDSHDKFIKELKKNDPVVTSGGLFARVVVVTQEYITLEVAPNVKVKVNPEHVLPVAQAKRAEKK